MSQIIPLPLQCSMIWGVNTLEMVSVVGEGEREKGVRLKGWVSGEG